MLVDPDRSHDFVKIFAATAGAGGLNRRSDYNSPDRFIEPKSHTGEGYHSWDGI
jgi:hypothetical protein